MKCTILHESRGRLRVHLHCGQMSLQEADLLEYNLLALPEVTGVKIYDRTQDAVIQYQGCREAGLHELGLQNLVMMTGDSLRTAQRVAAQVGVDEFYAEVLPEDKADFVRLAKAQGHRVIMIGDGINDSPALSEADAGIAISTGAAIAKEIADITIASEDLYALLTLRRISQRLMERIHRNYRFIVGFNFSLILLGVAGILPPTSSALLHNMSTLAISMKSMTDLLPPEELPRPE